MTPNEIAFTFSNITFRCPLIGKYTILTGDSATGKTFFFESLKTYLRLSKSDQYKYPLNTVNDGKIININNYSMYDVRGNLIITEILSIIKQARNTVICIDNADYILPRFPEILEVVRADRNNYYIIAGRGHYDISISRHNHLVAKFEAQTHTLEFVQEGLI